MDTPRIVFCRVGYMTYYAGPQPGDGRPVGGGKYNKTSIGHEVWNFAPLGRKVFGYLQPYLKNNTDVDTHIDLTRIDPSCKMQYISSVLVIFLPVVPRVVKLSWVGIQMRKYLELQYGMTEEKAETVIPTI